MSKDFRGATSYAIISSDRQLQR